MANTGFISSRILTLLVSVLFLWLGGCDRGPSGHGAPPPGPRAVSVVTVKPQKIELSTELPGRTAAFRIAEIRPQVSGLIKRRLFTEGTDVKTGQLLYEIDPAEFEAALENARAALLKAEANLPAIKLRAERLKKLLAVKAASKQDYDDAVSALKQAKAEIEYWKAQVKTARINLGYTKITAPISGRIGPSNVTEGAIVTAYQPTPLATIQQLDPIYVDVPRSTTELLRLRRRLESGNLRHNGMNQAKVKLILDDGTIYQQQGTLQFSDVSVDPTTGSVILRMIFPNPEKVLLPRMFVRAVIKEGVREAAILVPQQAVARTPKGEPYVLVVGAGEKAEIRMLKLNRAMGDKWLVDSGLSPGDRVVVEGLQFVRPGMSVKATPFHEGKEAMGVRGGHGAGQNTHPGGGA